MLRDYINVYGTGIYCPHKDKGILLFGSSGSGKTTLAHNLVEQHGFLHVGDDCLSIDTRSKKMSWGSIQLGGDRMELPGDVAGKTQLIYVPKEKRLYEASINLGVYVSRLGNINTGRSCLDGTMDAWHYLEESKVPIIRLDVADRPRTTLEFLLKRI